MPKLILANGQALDIVIDSYNPNITLGRANCELNLSDVSVSSKHAQISRSADGKLCLSDLGSTNGTFINGSQLKPQNHYSLQDGDEIQFGGISTTYSEKSEQNNNSYLPEQTSNNQVVHKNYEKAGHAPERYSSNSLKNAEYAGFWIRFGASFIDGLIVSAGSWILIIIVSVLTHSSLNKEFFTSPAYNLTNLINMVLGWLYYALQESSPAQATPGKMVFGLKVTDMKGDKISFLRATGRYWGKWVSSMILLIGYIMAAFSSRKQALHDKMAGCLVVKAPRY